MKAIELKALIKESIREVLREERLTLYQTLVPYVSNEEQAEVETELGEPLDYENNELVDMTNWVRYGGQVPAIAMSV